jgi:hypothetical protein
MRLSGVRLQQDQPSKSQLRIRNFNNSLAARVNHSAAFRVVLVQYRGGGGGMHLHLPLHRSVVFCISDFLNWKTRILHIQNYSVDWLSIYASLSLGLREWCTTGRGGARPLSFLSSTSQPWVNSLLYRRCSRISSTPALLAIGNDWPDRIFLCFSTLPKPTTPHGKQVDVLLVRNLRCTMPTTARQQFGRGICTLPVAFRTNLGAGP